MSRLLFSLLLTLSAHAITLEEVVRLSIENAPKLQELSYQQKIHEAQQRTVSATQYGSFDVVAQAEKHNLPRTLAPLTPSTISPDIASTTEPMGAGVSYSVQLFSGYAHTSAIAMEQLMSESVASHARLTKEQILFNVKTLYMSALGVKKKIEAQDRFIVWLEDFVTLTQEELSLGRRSQLDLLRVKTTLSSQEGVLVNLQSNYATLLATLQSYTNTPIDTLEAPNLTRFSFSTDETIEDLERLRGFDTQGRILEKALQKQQSTHYPQLYFYGYYGQNFGYNDETNPHEGDFENQEVWHAGLRLTYNLFDFGSKAAASEVLQTQILQKKTQKEQARRELKRDLEIIATKAEALQKELRSKEEELSLVAKSLEIESLRLHHGATSMSDFLELKAQHALLEASVIDSGYEITKLIIHQEYLLEQGNPNEN